MLRGLSSSPRTPATDEGRRYFVRLRQAEATTAFIGNDAADAAGFFLQLKRKSEGEALALGMGMDVSRWGKMGAGGYCYRFNGIERNEELGLDLAPFRSYDPAIGRWTSVDPLAELMPSMTPYRFGFNNPVLWSDPLGLFESRKEARKHKKANKLKGRVRKQEDGRYGIVNKRDHSITIDDGELGIVTAGYVQASGIDANPSGTNQLGGPALNMQDFVYNERRDAYENQQRTDYANFKLTGPPLTGTPLGGLVGPSSAVKGGSFFMKMLDGLGKGNRVKAGRKFIGNKTFLEYYKALYREGFRRVPGVKGTGKVQDMVNSATGEVISIRRSGNMSGGYKVYDTFFQASAKAGKSNIIFIK